LFLTRYGIVQATLQQSQFADFSRELKRLMVNYFLFLTLTVFFRLFFQDQFSSQSVDKASVVMSDVDVLKDAMQANIGFLSTFLLHFALHRSSILIAFLS
jgi:hypothetical protein